MQISVSNEFILKFENHLILKIKFKEAMSYRLILNRGLSLKLLKNVIDRSRFVFHYFIVCYFHIFCETRRYRSLTPCLPGHFVVRLEYHFL